MTIKIAFHNVQKLKSSKLQKFMSQIDVPIAFPYLKSYIDKYLPGVAEFEVVDDINTVNPADFDILGLSAYTDCFNQVQVIAKQAKEINPKLFIIIGGYHISALPHTLPPSVDCGVIGEGEETFKELLEVMGEEQTRPFPTGNFKKINGLVFREKENLVFTPKRDFIEPLDTIPFPDRNIIKDNRAMILKGSLSTSRGCPYNCYFCASNVVWGECKTRFFSKDYVMSELEYILNNTVFPSELKAIAFMDSLFISNKPRLYELVNGIEEKGFNKEVKFMITIRANLIDEETCKLLSRMNVSSVLIGMESGSSKILKNFNKRTTAQDNQLTLDLLYKYNIKPTCNFIFGSPYETIDDMCRSFDFIIKNKTVEKIELVNMFVLTPFPGTYYWDWAKEKGLVQDNMDFGRFGEITVPNSPMICTFEEWRTLREGYGIYLNNDIIEESKFYDVLNQFFNELVPFYMKNYSLG